MQGKLATGYSPNRNVGYPETARVMARTFERQVVELHVRLALLNRFTQLGRPTTLSVAATA
jgi:hypothetical protein